MPRIEPSLTKLQQEALAIIDSKARAQANEAQEELEHIFEMSNLRVQRLAELQELIRKSAQVAVHFHPFRRDKENRRVDCALFEDGVYQSQFVTGVSNGLLAPVPDSLRCKWEQRMFGSSIAGAFDVERPKYGALDLMGDADGPAPRFGSCYFLLKAHIKQRCTFSYGDTHRSLGVCGTAKHFAPVLAALFCDSFEREYALGHHNQKVETLLNRLFGQGAQPRTLPNPRFQQTPTGNLDHYIDAQIHGELRLARDVETLVCDSCFRQTKTGEILEQICERYDIALAWRSSSALPPSQVPMNFRGPTMPKLARSLAQHFVPGGKLNAFVLDQAHNELARLIEEKGTHHSKLFGTELDSLPQELKRLWHILVRYGGE